MLDGPKSTTRDSAGVTVDYKVSEYDVLSFQYSAFDAWTNNNTTEFMITQLRPDGFTPTSTQGTGEIRLTRAPRNRTNQTYMPTLAWRHDGSIWKATAGAGASIAKDANSGRRKGACASTVSRRTDVAISFEDIFYLRPRVIRVTDVSTGAPVDPYGIGSYALASGGDTENNTTDVRRSGYANLRRDFHGRWPLRRLELGPAAAPCRHQGGDERMRRVAEFARAPADPTARAFWNLRVAPEGE